MDLGIQAAAGLPIANTLPASWLGRSDMPLSPPAWAVIPALSNVQLRNLLAQIAYNESAWNYNLIGDDNELGRYQFEVQTLENYGLLAKGSVAAYGSDAVNYRHSWQSTYSPYENYFYNTKSLSGFLKNSSAQEHLAYQYILDLYTACINTGSIQSTDTIQTIAGMIYVAWTLGVGNGPTTSNSNGTGAWAWRYNNVGSGANSFNSGRYAMAILTLVSTGAVPPTTIVTPATVLPNPATTFTTVENMAVGSITTAAGQLVNAGAGKATSLISQADQLPNLNPRNPGEPIIARGIDAATNLSGWATGGG